ncbi:uncharacterized protein LOC114309040 [Camellia sinensis]|uniref:uncharacterized protein LOC114309040 n=1 Tax=Camellia sinensis TaxID=4442 RepID=UPI0010363782|nr:uncharacterized protein LOC114309040 [Camellia sinensis]
MAGHRRNDALMYLIFPASLGELGLKWFKRLPEGSIEGWQQLAETFVTRFKTNTQTPKEVDHFLSVKMEFGSSLQAYNAKYWETYNEILDCPTNLAITQYKWGLPAGHKLRDSLTMHQPTTMESLMQWINEHIQVEDDAATATEKENLVTADRRVAGKVHSVGQKNNRPNDRSKDQRRGSNRDDRNKGRRNDRANAPRYEEEDAKRKFKVQTSITTVFKIPIYRILSEIRGEPYVRWPAKLGNTQRGFNSRYCCTFHEERGHRTNDCLPLKQHLKELVMA